MVEVCYCPWQCELHGADISHQSLDILLSDAVLHGPDGNQLEELLIFLLGEGDCACLCVNCPLQYFLHTGTFTLPHPEIIHAYQVIRFSRQGREDPLEGLVSAIKDLVLLFRPSLHHCDQAIHITVYVGEAIHSVGRTRPCIGDIGDGSDPGTGSNLCMRMFTTSVGISNNAKKNLVDYTHPIGSTR